MCMESVVVRELIISASYFYVDAADSVMELSDFALLCRKAIGVALSIEYFFVTVLVDAYGSEVFFDMWIGMIQRPLDLFEKIHIGGKQIASKFYYTS